MLCAGRLPLAPQRAKTDADTKVFRMGPGKNLFHREPNAVPDDPGVACRDETDKNLFHMDWNAVPDDPSVAGRDETNKNLFHMDWNATLRIQ